jgi:hypothetical protein
MDLDLNSPQEKFSTFLTILTVLRCLYETKPLQFALAKAYLESNPNAFNLNAKQIVDMIHFHMLTNQIDPPSSQMSSGSNQNNDDNVFNLAEQLRQAALRWF